ncbi:MAG TPA: tRNA lysidine(34) synthetase TilS [Chitinophagaceae bacterium]
MNLPGKFSEYWTAHFKDLHPSNCRLLLAVSGGLDSVVLTDLVFNAGFTFGIAHCNFQLRDTESERDEGFVRALGERYGVEVIVKRFDTTRVAEENQTGIQETARHLRYNWFSELLAAEAGSNTLLVTAHHADDNVETVLFNIFRGTGINGLHGIVPVKHRFIRPLLFARRQEIKNYAVEQQLQWVEDSSNESRKYTRNYIRLEILPLIEKIFPAVTVNISNSIERWAEAGELCNQALKLHHKKLCVVHGTELHIPVLRLAQASPLKTITWSIIRDYGFSAAQLQDVLGLLDAASGKYVCSDTHRVLRNRNWLIISPLQNEAAENIIIQEGEKQLRFAGGKLNIENLSAVSVSKDERTATIDASQLRFPLLLRKWKQGDYFYPLGMTKKKKLSRFFIDRKLSIAEKEKIWVLESDRRIVWVLGQRIDHRFRITPSSSQVMKISWLES